VPATPEPQASLSLQLNFGSVSIPVITLRLDPEDRLAQAGMIRRAAEEILRGWPRAAFENTPPIQEEPPCPSRAA
jgi:hypothetical protein